MQLVACPRLVPAFERLGLGSPLFAQSAIDMYAPALAYDALLMSAALDTASSAAAAINIIASGSFEGTTGRLVWVREPAARQLLRDTATTEISLFGREPQSRVSEPVGIIAFADAGGVLSPMPGAPPVTWPDGSTWPGSIPAPLAAAAGAAGGGGGDDGLTQRGVAVIAALAALCAAVIGVLLVCVCRHCRQRAAATRKAAAAAAAPAAPAADAFGVEYLEHLYGTGNEFGSGRAGGGGGVPCPVAAWLARNAPFPLRGSGATTELCGRSSSAADLWVTEASRGSASAAGSWRGRRSGGKGVIKRAGAFIGLGSDGAGTPPRRAARSMTNVADIGVRVRSRPKLGQTHGSTVAPRMFGEPRLVNVRRFDHVQLQE